MSSGHLVTEDLFIWAMYRFLSALSYLARRRAPSQVHFDLISGWVLWAPFTFVIVGFMGFAVGAITEKKKTIYWCALSLAVALAIKLVGYYIAEWIIFGNMIAPLQSVPGNIIQVGMASVLVLIAIKPLEAAAKKVGIRYV